jgi:TrkA domain protein
VTHRAYLPTRTRRLVEDGRVDVKEVPNSPFVDRLLGATRARTRTGASIVAIVREDQIFASPGPTEILSTGDVLVVIGTEDGIAGVKRIVDEG